MMLRKRFWQIYDYWLLDWIRAYKSKCCMCYGREVICKCNIRFEKKKLIAWTFRLMKRLIRSHVHHDKQGFLLFSAIWMFTHTVFDLFYVRTYHLAIQYLVTIASFNFFMICGFRWGKDCALDFLQRDETLIFIYYIPTVSNIVLLPKPDNTQDTES